MGDWVFTGRTVAFAQSMAALLRKHPGVFVTGPAGAGRSRFARELHAATGDRLGPGAWVAGSAATATVPLGAFGMPAGSDLSAAAARITAHCRGVLVVDDVHLLDRASIALLHRLVTTRAVPVVLTAPSGGAGDLAKLWKDGHLDRVDLEAPSVTALRDLLEAGLGAQVERGTATRLHTLTGGDLALVRSLVDDETAALRLRPVAGVWLWTGEPTLSPRTVDLLDAHVPVPDDALPAVELVAAGGTVPADMLHRLAGGPAVEAAERADLLTTGDGGTTLAVPLLRLLVCTRAGSTRTGRLFAALRSELGSRPPDDPADPEPDPDPVAALARGRFCEVIRLVRDTIAVHTAEGRHTEPAHTLLAQALGMHGDATGAAAALAAAGSSGVSRRQHLLARAWAAAAAGAVSEAISHAQHAAVLARDDADRDAEIAALHAAVRFGDPGGAARLAALAGIVPGADLAAAHAAALAAADGAALDAVAARLAERSALPAAADAAAQAAAAHERAGARGRAIAAAARAQDLAQRCDDAVTPALRAAARPLPLTAREREVTSLAAGGLSNREIAERLVVSVRTVEGHLYRACAKLHVDTRGELEAVLG